VTTALLLALATGLARRRDVGAGLFPRHDSADPRLWLLTSPTAQALRAQATVVTAWLAGTAAFLMILGVVSHSLSTADVPANVQRQIAKLGSGSIVTPTGYIAFLFLFVALAICLFVCTQISALRRDEEQHLESVLAQPVSRSSWLAGRLILAAFAAAAIALAAGIAAWVGATAAGVHVPLPSLLEAGVNALPIAILFLGLGGLVYALVPRVAAGIMYGLVAAAFLWQLVGALIGPPHWVLDLSPFAHLALVPSQPFQPVSAAVLVTVGVLGVISSLVAFSHRDIAGQ
jgi:ABC-2 type transport system permease protein